MGHHYNVIRDQDENSGITSNFYHYKWCQFQVAQKDYYDTVMNLKNKLLWFVSSNDCFCLSGLDRVINKIPMYLSVYLKSSQKT